MITCHNCGSFLNKRGMCPNCTCNEQKYINEISKAQAQNNVLYKDDINSMLGWQCPCCRTVYAPRVFACQCMKAQTENAKMSTDHAKHVALNKVLSKKWEPYVPDEEEDGSL